MNATSAQRLSLAGRSGIILLYWPTWWMNYVPTVVISLEMSAVVISEVMGGSVFITLHSLFAVHFSFTGFLFNLPTQASLCHPFPFLH